MIHYLLFVVALLLSVHYLFNNNKNALLLKKIPGFKYHFIIGNALEVILPPVKIFELGRTLAKQYNGIYRFWSFPLGAVGIYNPEDIEIILSGMTFHQKSEVYKFLKPWLQDGLLLSNGSKWQDRRKILTPAFHFNILCKYFVNLKENTSRLLETLNKNLDSEMDIVPIISECTLHSICETAMGTRLNDEKAGTSYKEAIYDLGLILVKRFVRLHMYSDFIFNISSLGRKHNKHVAAIHNFTRNVINDRKNFVLQNGINLSDTSDRTKYDDYKLMYSKKRRTAMLDLLILAEKDGLIDSTGIQEEVDTFMFEGHDTTAAGLIYCLLSLANHPIIQDKAVNELKEIFGETKRETTIEDLTAMRYLDRCIKESLRLNPPVPFISRKLNRDVELSNYTVPAGTSCHIHIYDLHRSENLYPNPTKFDPDRFLPENVVGRHNYAYIPFSAGPRNCIGQKFALMQMKLTISSILRNFKLLPVTTDSDLRFQADLILRNSKPVYVKFIKRENMI